MKLNEYIEMKKEELLKNGMRSAKFQSAHEYEIGRCSITFLLFGSKEAEADAEVEEFDRTALADGETVDSYGVSFAVIKPRCRKAVTETFYVKAL